MLPYTITSPGFSDPVPKYPSNSDCAWRIDTEFGQTLKVNGSGGLNFCLICFSFQVTFVDFQLEKTCRDYLRIYNGPDAGSPLIDTFCGLSTSATSIISQDENLYLHFHSDDSTEGRGLKIIIETNHTDCGGILYQPGVDLRSPGFPNKYEANVECEWELRSLPGSHIGLVFVDRFHLESSPDCANDFVKVYNLILVIFFTKYFFLLDI